MNEKDKKLNFMIKKSFVYLSLKHNTSMKRFLLLLLSIALANVLFSQVITKESEPRSFNELYLLPNENLNSYKLPSIDVQNLLYEDAQETKENGNRIGVPFEVNLNLQNSGTWEYLHDGSRIWRLKIESSEALHLSVDYDNLYLPVGSELYIYSSNKKDIRGAYTSENNREDGFFLSYLIQGSSCVIEYYEPKEVYNQGSLKLKRIYFGYKGPDDFGDADTCNNNINCPIGIDWQIDKKSQALSIFGSITGLRNCSGAMVNNVREDGMPYYLTARHCLTGTEDTWTFLYNYESPTCVNIDGSLTDWVLGSSVIATDAPSDFALLLLDESPPVTYDVYYSGWDARDTIKDSVVCIHHPRGDVKKISFDYDSIATGVYGSSPPLSHWEVKDWDDGTTEPSSSGSPLFDKYHHIIGQLHGGTAACGNNNPDFYGKFSYSWNNGGSPSERLDFWLDPDSLGVMVLDGNDFNDFNDSLDLAIVNLFDLKYEYCDSTIQGVKFYVRNIGKDTIYNALFFIMLNDSLIDSLSWSGTLNAHHYMSEEVPAFYANTGKNELSIVIAKVNGGLDSNQVNDTIHKYFFVNQGNSFKATFNTDFWGNETSYFLIDANLDTIASRDGFPSSTSIIEEVCLSEGCFAFVLKDAANDGIDSPGGVSLSNNNVNFRNIPGTSFNDSMVVVNFCFCDKCVYLNLVEIDCDTVRCVPPPPRSIELKKDDSNYIEVFPNPGEGNFNIHSENRIHFIYVYDVFGRKIQDINYEVKENKYELNLTSKLPGIYFLKIDFGNDNISTLKVVVNK